MCAFASSLAVVTCSEPEVCRTRSKKLLYNSGTVWTGIWSGCDSWFSFVSVSVCDVMSDSVPGQFDDAEGDRWEDRKCCD